ncbi:MAG: hypothetical protein ACRDQE_04010 [Gaiellales bacterium]
MTRRWAASDEEVEMSRRLRVLSAVVALVVAGTVIAAEASAAPIHARGTQTVIDETAGTFAMHGTLVGTWFTTSFVPTYDSPTLFAAKGTERFVGCVDTNRNKTCNASEPQGTMRFDFIYWANFNGTTGAFKHAQCVHPVTRGTGSFAGATGLLLMDDRVHGQSVKTNYHGEIQLAGGASASQSVPALAGAPRAALGMASSHPAC